MTHSAIRLFALFLLGNVATFAPATAYAEEADYILHSFGQGTDGQNPVAALIKVNGLFYGTTPTGGAHGAGTIYSMTPQGVETVLYSFNGFLTEDGALPNSSLTYVGGVFYGTTEAGGAANQGTVFSFVPGASATVLYSFLGDGGSGPGTGPQDGSSPSAELLYFDGALYGTAGGGSHNDGVVFRVKLDGTETILHDFNRQTGDGGAPSGGLLESSGVFYGLTGAGGNKNNGTVFALTPAGSYQLLYSFQGGNDGFVPSGTLIDVGAALYGTTQGGGYYGKGTVFSVTPGGAEQVIHSFGSLKGQKYPGGGQYPYSGLIEIGGLLYGTTLQGGITNGGVVYSMTLQGVDTVIHASLGGVDGSGIYGRLKNGGAALYGVRYGGGADNKGVAFRLVTPKP